MSKNIFRWGGVAASIMLVAFGVGAIVIGTIGRADVRDAIKRENIVGSGDMTPAMTRAAVAEAGLTGQVDIPSCSVAGTAVSTGAEAKCFADYMRVHTLESTQGRTYAELGRFLTPDGKDTSDEAAAAKDAKTGQPVSNPARNLWVTETALSTALNTSFFAERVAVFSIVMGVALLLTGVGFLILTLGGALGRFSVRVPQIASGKAVSAGGR